MSVRIGGKVPLTTGGELIIATDASVKDGIHSISYLTSEGDWGVAAARFDTDPCGGNCPGASELRAMYFGLRSVPLEKEVTLLTDARGCLVHIRRWQHGATSMPKWYQKDCAGLEEQYDLPLLTDFRFHLLHRGERLTAEWVEGHGSNLFNRGAHQLAALGNRLITNFRKRRHLPWNDPSDEGAHIVTQSLTRVACST